mgnify:CR=1 FL=1
MRIEDNERELSNEQRMRTIKNIEAYQAAQEAEISAKAARPADQDVKLEGIKTETDKSLEKSGMQKLESAQTQASAQQDQGESWQRFSDKKPGEDIPQSVEEIAKASKEADQKPSDEPAQVSVRALQNELSVQQRMIRS